MSYSYIGTFVDVRNHKILESATLNILKSLNMHAYHCDLRDIAPTGVGKSEDYPEITKDVYYEFVSYYKKEVRNGISLWPYRRKDWNKTQNAFFLEEEIYEKCKDVLEPYAVKPTLEEYKSFDENNDDIIILYVKRVKNNNGQWYRRKDFEAAQEKITRNYIDKVVELRELKKLKNTKDWFEMSEEGRSNYYEEVNDLECAIEDDYKPELDAIEYILNVFDFLQDTGTRVFNEFGELIYEWDYDDHREIELYIEVD